jgi:hypothetical protein
MAYAMVMKLLINCLPTSTWPIVTFLPDQILASDAMACETLPVTAPVVAEPPMLALTSPMIGWLWPAMVTGPVPRAHRGDLANRHGQHVDAIGAEHPLIHVGDVHGAALARSQRLAHQLGDQARDVDALGDAVAAAPVGGRSAPCRTTTCQ